MIEAMPLARPIEDFSSQWVENDLILLDASTLQYHTLNATAVQIWRACDGTKDVAALAQTSGLPLEVVEVTVGELGEASLLQEPASGWSVSMSRRRAAQIIAAGVLGGVSAPSIQSITVPSSASAQTQPTVPAPPVCRPIGAGCTASSQCCQGCCKKDNSAHDKDTCQVPVANHCM